jgi:hypothetical protein
LEIHATTVWTEVYYYESVRFTCEHSNPVQINQVWQDPEKIQLLPHRGCDGVVKISPMPRCHFKKSAANTPLSHPSL